MGNLFFKGEIIPLGRPKHLAHPTLSSTLMRFKDMQDDRIMFVVTAFLLENKPMR
jgi:hypothetical protein